MSTRTIKAYAKRNGKPKVSHDVILTRIAKAKIMALRIIVKRVQQDRLPREVLYTKQYRQLICEVQGPMISKHTRKEDLIALFEQADEINRILAFAS